MVSCLDKETLLPLELHSYMESTCVRIVSGTCLPGRQRRIHRPRTSLPDLIFDLQNFDIFNTKLFSYSQVRVVFVGTNEVGQDRDPDCLGN